MLDATFINALATLIGESKSQAPKITPLPAVTGYEPYRFINPRGQVEELHPPAPPRAEYLTTIEGFIEFVGQNAAEAEEDQRTHSIAYANMTRLLYFRDRRNPREFAVCPLETTKPWQWLHNYGGKGIMPAEAVQALRVVFRECGPPAELLATLRNLRFNVDKEEEVDLQQGREAMGKKVESRVTGAGHIPEEFVLRAVPVLRGWRFAPSIRLVIELYPAQGKLAFSPIADTLREAERACLEDIVDKFHGHSDVMPGMHLGGPLLEDKYKVDFE